jgi:hypothetical protein
MTFGWRERRVAILSAAIGLYYAVLGLVVLVPEGVYSGDIGVQYVQAQAILDHRFRSLDISYPGEFLDPDRVFFPIRPPFVMNAGGTIQSIFPPASALLQAVGVSAFGLRGMILISVIAGWVTLYCAARLAPPRARAAVLVALGLASPLWFYAVSGWHHAAGMAFGTAAFMFALRRSGGRAAFLAGLSLGAGAVLRDEVILLAPGLAVALWWRARAFRAILLMAGGALAALTLAATIDVWWFDRPAAAHLRHAVHLLQSALQTADAPNAEVPVLHPMTLAERQETVVYYWLLGHGNVPVLTTYLIGLAIALFVRWKFRSSAGILVWLAGVIALTAVDFRELITAPKWLAGLFRVAPYLVFALLPAPIANEGDGTETAFAKAPARETADLMPRVALVTSALYLIIAFAGVDTTGGKGLGPRLLLPLLPILTVPAITRIGAYLRARATPDRWVGRAGALLVVMTLIMHSYATTAAYYGRNRDDSSVVLAVDASPERIVVADDVFTAQLLFPLYYRKIIFLADSPGAAAALATALRTQHLSGALLVSRNLEAPPALPGLRMRRTEQIGRMNVTHWVR